MRIIHEYQISNLMSEFRPIFAVALMKDAIILYHESPRQKRGKEGIPKELKDQTQQRDKFDPEVWQQLHATMWAVQTPRSFITEQDDVAHGRWFSDFASILYWLEEFCKPGQPNEDVTAWYRNHWQENKATRAGHPAYTWLENDWIKTEKQEVKYNRMQMSSLLTEEQEIKKAEPQSSKSATEEREAKEAKRQGSEPATEREAKKGKMRISDLLT